MPRRVKLNIDLTRDRKLVRNMDRFAHRKVSAKFEKDKRELINKFENHNVTKEIRGGPSQKENISDTLGGRGNLFSFIGFPIGTDPIEPVLEHIKQSTFLENRGKVNKRVSSGTKIQFNYTFHLPTVQSFGQFKLPWEPGRSWVLGVQEGISGFGAYIFHEFFSQEYSRSTTGLQLKVKGKTTHYRSGSFRPVSYVSEIIRGAERDIRNTRDMKI